MEFILIVLFIFIVAGICESPNDQAKRTKRLDPGGRDDFGGRL